MATTEPRIDKNVSRLEAQLELWNAKFSEIMAKAKDTGEQAKEVSRGQLEEVKVKLEAARSKLEDARAAGSDKWDTLKDGVEQTWQELERTFKNLIHR